MVMEISTVYRFSLISEKEFLHKCQQLVGRWSIHNGQNVVNVVCEPPFINCFILIMLKNGVEVMQQNTITWLT